MRLFMTEKRIENEYWKRRTADELKDRIKDLESQVRELNFKVACLKSERSQATEIKVDMS